GKSITDLSSVTTISLDLAKLAFEARGVDASARVIEETALAGVKIITPRKLGDHRGFFSETYNRRALAAAGVDLQFVQDNHSVSAQAGTLRGLHFQTPPFAQDKLV